MYRLARFLYLIVLALAGLTASCHRPLPWPNSRIDVSNPADARQLLFGFYDIEGSDRHWRWASPVFGVALRPPDTGSTARSATLKVELYFPQTEIDQIGPITFHAASQDQVDLGKETFSVGGLHEFVTTVPARLLCTNVLPLIFSLDKFVPHSPDDARDRAVVVTSIGLWSQ